MIFKSKKKFKFIFIASIVLFSLTIIFSQKKSFAEEREKQIDVVLNIENVSNPITNVYKYEIIPSKNNMGNVENEPKKIEVKFENVKPNKDYVATASGVIDFSETKYSKPGVYAYTIKEIESNNETDFPVSDDSFEFYVVVTIENGEYKVDVEKQVLNVNSQEKQGNIEFNHITNIKFEKSVKTGVLTNRAPFVIIIVISIVGIFIIKKEIKVRKHGNIK